MMIFLFCITNFILLVLFIFIMRNIYNISVIIVNKLNNFEDNQEIIIKEIKKFFVEVYDEKTQKWIESHEIMLDIQKKVSAKEVNHAIKERKRPRPKQSYKRSDEQRKAASERKRLYWEKERQKRANASDTGGAMPRS